MADIQYAPLPAPKIPPTPAAPNWLEPLGRFLEAVFGPIGRLVGMSWPILQYVLIAIGVVLAGFLLWRWIVAASPILRRKRAAPLEDAQWVPDHAEAVALLGDADRLAGEGRFGEATHLLLRRSIDQISLARPEWLTAASTPREIASLPGLPDAGRRSFGVIAQRAERAVFALRDLDASDWEAARAAYAFFAKVELRG